VITQCKPEELDKPVLEQQHYPLAFLSGSFHGADQRWPTVEQETFAIKEACIKAAHLLQRTDGFHIFTDHRNLTYIFNPQAAAADGRKQAAERLERWQVLMRAFYYQIHHVAGDDNTVADMISRWAAPISSSPSSTSAATDTHTLQARSATRRRHANITPSADPTFAPDVAVQFNVSDAPTEEEVAAAQQDDSTIQTLDLHKDVDGIYNTAQGQMYVPDSNHLRLRISIVAHQGPAGHRGIHTTEQWIRERFWWPTMHRDIHVFCRTCLQCQYTRGGKVVPRPLMNTFVATQPNQILHFDFMHIQAATATTPQQYLLVMIDGYSKFVRLVPAVTADAATVVSALLDWFAMFGIARRFVSDQGSHFNNEVLTLLQQRLLIQHHFTAAYAPWSNGQVERVNREVRELLSALLSENKLSLDAWTSLVPIVNHILNNTPSRRLGGHAPITVFTSRKPTSPLNVIFRPLAEEFSTVTVTTDGIKEHVQRTMDAMHDIHANVAAVQLPAASARPGERPVDFDVGDYVLVSAAHGRKRGKLHTLWTGPARVVDQLNPRRFKVLDLATSRELDVHAEHLKRYADKDLKVTPQLVEFAAHGGAPPTVERLCGHRLTQGQWHLKVLWQGYPPEDATWEPLSNLFEDITVIVQRYIKALPPSREKKRLTAALISL
jgi:hypothetical protein